MSPCRRRQKKMKLFLIFVPEKPAWSGGFNCSLTVLNKPFPALC
jgi:hypothetical protein